MPLTAKLFSVALYAVITNVVQRAVVGTTAVPAAIESPKISTVPLNVNGGLMLWVCHVAVVADVATNTWLIVGGAAADMTTSLPVVLKLLAETVLVVPVIFLFVNVSVLVLVTIVSVISGRVSVRLAVWLDARVTVVPVVAPVFSKLSRLVASILSTIKV